MDRAARRVLRNRIKPSLGAIAEDSSDSNVPAGTLAVRGSISAQMDPKEMEELE